MCKRGSFLWQAEMTNIGSTNWPKVNSRDMNLTMLSSSWLTYDLSSYIMQDIDYNSEQIKKVKFVHENEQ